MDAIGHALITYLSTGNATTSVVSAVKTKISRRDVAFIHDNADPSEKYLSRGLVAHTRVNDYVHHHESFEQLKKNLRPILQDRGIHTIWSHVFMELTTDVILADKHKQDIEEIWEDADWQAAKSYLTAKSSAHHIGEIVDAIKERPARLGSAYLGQRMRRYVQYVERTIQRSSTNQYTYLEVAQAARNSLNHDDALDYLVDAAVSDLQATLDHMQ